MQVTIARQLGLEPTTVGNFFMNARRRSMDKWKDDEPKSASQGTTSPSSQHHLDFDDDDDDDMDLDLANDSDLDSSDHNHHNRSDSDLLWQHFGDNFGDHHNHHNNTQHNKFTHHNILSGSSSAVNHHTDDLTDADLYHSANSVSTKLEYDSFSDYGTEQCSSSNNGGGGGLGHGSKKYRVQLEDQLIHHQNGFDLGDELPRCSRTANGSSNDTNNNSLGDRRSDNGSSSSRLTVAAASNFDGFDDNNHLFYHSNGNTMVCQSEV